MCYFIYQKCTVLTVWITIVQQQHLNQIVHNTMQLNQCHISVCNIKQCCRCSLLLYSEVDVNDWVWIPSHSTTAGLWIPTPWCCLHWTLNKRSCMPLGSGNPHSLRERSLNVPSLWGTHWARCHGNHSLLLLCRKSCWTGKTLYLILSEYFTQHKNVIKYNYRN